MVGLTAIGAAIRFAGANHAMFGDELSTYWIITTHHAGLGGPALHGLGGVFSLLGYAYHGGVTPEISPPLYFAASWLTSQLGHSTELVRLPSLLAGIGIIPLTYLLGLRTIGRSGALVAGALAALCPFLIYYSSEARAYSLLMFLLLVTTLSMLQALDSGRRRWWVLYAVASAAAMLAHYTAGFLLAGQLLWLLWTHRETWRAALVANVGAAILFAPWLPSAIRELRSPTVKILSALSPFDFTSARLSLEHWVIGYPYTNLSLKTLPGTPALVLLGIAVVVSVGALALRARGTDGWRPRIDQRLALVLVLALSVPVGEALQSAVSTHTFGGRNLAGSTIGVLLLLAALLCAPRRPLGFVTAGLAVVAFVIGAIKMTEPANQRPNLAAGAAYVERLVRPGDAVIDETVALSPGPVSPLDTVLRPGIPVFRAGNAAERDHPFGLFDPIVHLRTAVAAALARYPSGRLFFVMERFADQNRLTARIDAGSATTGGVSDPSIHLPGAYRKIGVRDWPGFPSVRVEVYARSQ